MMMRIECVISKEEVKGHQNVPIMLKKIFAASLVVLATACGSRSTWGNVSPAIANDGDLESRVKSIVSGMSLDDKIGQMC